MSLIEDLFHKKTIDLSWDVGEPAYISTGFDLQGETLPSVIDSNGYRFELDNGIPGHFHLYRCTKTPINREIDGKPFAEILAKLGGES